MSWISAFTVSSSSPRRIGDDQRLQPRQLLRQRILDEIRLAHPELAALSEIGTRLDLLEEVSTSSSSVAISRTPSAFRSTVKSPFFDRGL